MKKADLAHVTVCTGFNELRTSCTRLHQRARSRLCPCLGHFPALPLHLRRATLRATLSDTAICCYITVDKEKAEGWCPTWIPLQTQTSATTSLAIPLCLSRARDALKNPNLSIKTQHILQKKCKLLSLNQKLSGFQQKVKKNVKAEQNVAGIFNNPSPPDQAPAIFDLRFRCPCRKGEKGAEPGSCRKSWFSAETAEVRSHSSSVCNVNDVNRFS